MLVVAVFRMLSSYLNASLIIQASVNNAVMWSVAVLKITSPALSSAFSAFSLQRMRFF